MLARRHLTTSPCLAFLWSEMYLDRVHVAKKIGLGLTGLVGLAVLIYTGEALRGKSAWENFKKEWEAN